MKIKNILIVLLSIVTVSVSAQKLSGNISPLKNQKEVNVVLDFTGTLAEGRSEETYIEIKTNGKTEEEKAQFLSEWNEQLRNDAYNLLVEKMENVVNPKLFSVGNYPNSEYTIYVKVADLNPGAFLTINSWVKADVSFVKTGETTPFATVNYKRVLGMRSSYVATWVPRAAMAFGYLGDNIGKVISKNLK